jgi:hypothetical protein
VLSWIAAILPLIEKIFQKRASSPFTSGNSRANLLGLV